MIENGPVRIGVVGAGHRGGTFVDELRHLPQGRLTALCDVLPARLNLFHQRWQLDGVLRTTDLDQLLRGDLVDAVLITVPDRFHRAVAVKCLEAGKDILLEKPLAPTAEDCRAIIAAHRKSGRLLQMGFVLRATRFYRKVKEIVDSGRLGQIMFVRACEYLSVEHGASFMTRWHRKKANAGTFLLSKCSHDLDLLNWIIGSRPTHVASFGGNDFFRPGRGGAALCSQCGRAECRYRFENFRGWHYLSGEDVIPGTDLCAFNDDKDVVDNQVVILEYANHVRATFELQMFYPEESTRFITIGGEKGYLSGCLEKNRLRLHCNDDDVVEEMSIPSGVSGHAGGDREFLRGFIAAVATRQAPVADLSAGLACNVIAEAVEKARLEERVVTIDPREYDG